VTCTKGERRRLQSDRWHTRASRRAAPVALFGFDNHVEAVFSCGTNISGLW
jgi:hypothetical protein